MKNRFVLSLLLLMTIAPLAFGTTTTINFDDVSGGTQINNQYTGVTFTFNPCTGSSLCFSGTSSAAFATAASVNHSASNVISPWAVNGGIIANFDTRVGVMQADFATAQKEVSIDVMAMLAIEPLGSFMNAPFMTAYFNNGTRQTIYYPDAWLQTGGNCAGFPGGGCFGPWETLTATAPDGTGIDYIRFSSTYQGDPFVYAEFDNLVFTDAGGTTNPPVPEPASLVLLGSGLAAIYKLRRR